MSSAGGRTVLVVEDEAFVRLLVVQSLEEAGYAVRQAAEAIAAMDAVRSDDAISLMITDVGLPGVDGRRLADQARQHRPDMKVLLMTGYTQAASVEDALPAGIALINKPFDLDELMAKAGALLDP
jgi:DNA-binding NtrC family response regulator